jgi:hypothetical protein
MTNRKATRVKRITTVIFLTRENEGDWKFQKGKCSCILDRLAFLRAYILSFKAPFSRKNETKDMKPSRKIGITRLKK